MSFVAASWPWRETCVRRGYLYVDTRLFHRQRRCVAFVASLGHISFSCISTKLIDLMGVNT